MALRMALLVAALMETQSSPAAPHGLAVEALAGYEAAEYAVEADYLPANATSQ